MPVEFVSAGLLEGTIKEPKSLSTHELGSESDDESVAPSSSSVSPPDTTRAMAQMAIRSPSPAVSEAPSECSDQVVFRGRGTTSAPLSTTTTSRVESPLPEKQAVAANEVLDKVIEEANTRAQSIAARVAESASISAEDVHVHPKVSVSVRVKGIVQN